MRLTPIIWTIIFNVTSWSADFGSKLHELNLQGKLDSSLQLKIDNLSSSLYAKLVTNCFSQENLLNNQMLVVIVETSNDSVSEIAYKDKAANSVCYTKVIKEVILDEFKIPEKILFPLYLKKANRFVGGKSGSYIQYDTSEIPQIQFGAYNINYCKIFWNKDYSVSININKADNIENTLVDYCKGNLNKLKGKNVNNENIRSLLNFEIANLIERGDLIIMDNKDGLIEKSITRIKFNEECGIKCGNSGRIFKIKNFELVKVIDKRY